ncbi:hypothetical protein CYY_002605 [Polysphondylium violaceum]|uniref:Guanylate cyclase domain-containing protein n=1 Tax=Polysphondylium violaceum TaxID=133409 RepID=A0A8J4Q7Q4_9MYCE|nr:hypothetical protein CYY_002605 [Polysphondylium violaceum]
MMFALPDVRREETGIKKYLRLIDLRFPRVQEERHFQSYYFYNYVKQIRIAFALLTMVMFIGTIVDYVSPLDLSQLPYYDISNQIDYNNATAVAEANADMPDYLDYNHTQRKNALIIRMSMIGVLIMFTIFTFTKYFKRYWKFFTSLVSFLGTCVVIAFVHDVRTMPERMVVLFISICLASGLTFLAAAISSFGLWCFYFLYFFIYIRVYHKSFLLISLFILVSWIILMVISRAREQLIRKKFRTLENLKIQTLRSEKIINQMLPAIVVQRLRVQNSTSKEQSLINTIVSDSSTNSNSTEATFNANASSVPPSPPLHSSTNSNNSPLKLDATILPNQTPENTRRTIVDPQSPSSIQPGSISGEMIVDSYDPVTVLFCEIVNFQALIEKMPATQVINLLNEVYNSFDRLTDVYGVTKVEHIGNVYMVVGGCPELCQDHAQRVAHMSLGMLSIIRRYGIVQVRLGIHTGPVVGGIIGKKKLSWHLFGDTINTSSRMASHSSIGRIQVSQPVHQLLKSHFLFEDRGKIQVKGKGLMRTFYLIKTKTMDKRYTSIFSSLHREKPYIPPVDISEVSYDNPKPEEPPIVSSSPSNPSHLTAANRTSLEILSGRRERKGSIFASVVPPKVLNFLHVGSGSNNEGAIDSPRGSNKNPPIERSNSTQNLSNISGFDSVKKKSVAFQSPNSSLSKARAPSPATILASNEDDEAMEENSIPMQETNIELGKGIRGSNVITSNNTQLSKLEKDLKKHYTLDRFRLWFKSRGNIVENQFNSDYTDSIFRRVLLSVLLFLAIFSISAIYDYFFLKKSAISSIILDLPIFNSTSSSSASGSGSGSSSKSTNAVIKRVVSKLVNDESDDEDDQFTDSVEEAIEENERYDHVSGARFGLVFFSLILLYIFSKFKHFKGKKHIQIIGTIFFISLSAITIVLSSIPPLNELPVEGVVLTSIIMYITITYSFSGIKFWYANIMCAFAILFFEVSIAWKKTDRDIMLSHNYYLFTAIVINFIVSNIHELYSRQNWVHSKLLEKDKRETEQLVSEILPGDVVQLMKSGRQLIVDEFQQVTIFLSDIVGFTEMAARMTPRQLVETLNQIYSTFDAIAAEFGVLKVATIGDAYLCVSGCPEKNEDHAFRVANMAVKMLESIKSIRTVDNIPVRMRIGIHTGPVVAGIVGIKMIHYQLWGESVQIAQQMESSGRADHIHVSEDTFSILKSKYMFEERPEGTIKNRKMKTYFLLRERVESDPPVEVETKTVSIVKGGFGGTFQFNQTNNENSIIPSNNEKGGEEKVFDLNNNNHNGGNNSEMYEEENNSHIDFEPIMDEIQVEVEQQDSDEENGKWASQYQDSDQEN